MAAGRQDAECLVGFRLLDGQSWNIQGHGEQYLLLTAKETEIWSWEDA